MKLQEREIDGAAEAFESRIADETYRDLGLEDLIKLAFKHGARYAIDELTTEQVND